MRIYNRLTPIAIVAAVFIAYANSLWGDFQFDDYNVIVFNPRVHSFGAWWQDAGSGIRQLLKLTYTLNWVIGPHVFGFHVFNTTCHALNSLFIFYLTKRFTNNAAIAFLTAILFAVHPIQTESVTYISGRSSSLMAVFYLGGLLAYAKIEGSSKWGGRWGILSVFLFFLAILTKEVSLTFPFTLVLWELSKSEKTISFKDMFKRQIFHWLLFFSSLFVFFLSTRYARLITYSMNIRSLKSNLLSQLNGITSTASHYILVNRLNIDPDLPVLRDWNLTVGIEFTFLCLLFAVSVACLILLRARQLKNHNSTQKNAFRFIAFSVFWIIIQLIPTSTLIPRIDIINERHFYLAGWGIFLLFSVGFACVSTKIINNIKWLWIVTIMLIIVLGGFTVSRNNTYRTEIALWEDTVKKSPKKARGYNNLGYAYFLAGRYNDAILAYAKALEINPNFTLARNNMELAIKVSMELCIEK
ncbi:MAG: tetratricopeptide repeat protein [Syntrophorhabdaceae bacterium]|nr:tetratricopeptide repeat protein [Syntrophorhabdaceae bacterium]